MMKSRLTHSSFVTSAVTSLLVFFATTPCYAQESLTAARDLYASAAYEDALVVLDRLAAVNNPPDRFSINQYRAFCLLALGRATDAERAIEAVVSDRPLYHPTDSEASPRLRSAFTTVRQRMLPTIVQQKYTQAKTAFDQKDFAAAELGFGQVLETLADPDVKPAASRPPLADLGTLAAGFRDLASKQMAVAVEAAKVQAAKEQAAATPPPAPTPARRIYNAGETNVVPPTILRQDFPPYPRNVGALEQGSMEVIINEIGYVESATIRISVNPRYDQMIVQATRNWRYAPATIAGTPVKFRKQLAISIKPGD